MLQTPRSEERGTLLEKITIPSFGRKIETSEERSWPNLLVDLWNLIINRLSLVDRFHLGLACKILFTITSAAPRYNGLLLGSPCLLILSNDYMTCSLISPIYNERYIVNTPSLHLDDEIFCSKYGWLLMGSEDRISISTDIEDLISISTDNMSISTDNISTDNMSIFFFNPLTKATIDLPNKEFTNNYSFSFTSPPTSSDCVVVALEARNLRVTVNICSRGDKNWHEIYLEHNYRSFYMSYAELVFNQGLFYCLGNDGMLGIFDHVNETWDIMGSTVPHCPLNSRRLYLTVSNGELLLVSTKKRENVIINIYKLDVRNQWQEMDKLGDTDVYCGRQSFICSNAVPGRGGRLYFQLIKNEELAFYSCETRELHPSNNFHGDDYRLVSCWIEPMWVQPSAEELQWSKF